MGNRVLARFVRGIGDKAAEIGHRDRLSRRARGHRPDRHARSRAALADAAGRRRPPTDAARLNTIFDESRRRADADVHPPPAARARVRRHAPASGRWSAGALRALQRRVQPHRPAGGRRCPPASRADGFPLARRSSSARPTSEARLVSLSRPARAGAQTGRRTARRWRHDARASCARWPRRSPARRARCCARPSAARSCGSRPRARRPTSSARPTTPPST